MPYADYTYYKDTYGGNISEADFNSVSRQASAYLNRITFNKVKNAVTDEVKDACCSVADVMFKQREGGEITSESVGSWSRQYKTSGKSYDQKLYDAAEMYLALTGLLYCGGGM
ncbi:head-tail connector protein [Anaerovorax odorimutans]|uniref:hypothetical protein n=1 Tax=Anaerovorax odorimutans TaxID=109327 RepID=UPI0003FC8297|nr:hypothetical protein [Anaerovorax odorimutans]